MNPVSVYELANITKGQIAGPGNVFSVDSVSTDSRRIPANALFVALPGNHHDGHDFIGHAFANGASAALVSRPWAATHGSGLTRTCIVVDDPLVALQDLGRWWRRRFDGKVVAITGSNGKTIVKDALVELVSSSLSCAGTIGSYNSQLGVPLALLRMPREADVWVVEAGVSGMGEMERLQRMIDPDAGILTNIGMAHIAGFGSREAIAREKIRLFSGIPSTGWILLPEGEPLISPLVNSLKGKIAFFGGRSADLPVFGEMHAAVGGMFARMVFPDGQTHAVILPTPSRELALDLEAAAAAAWLLGVSPEEIARRITDIRPGQTRMEIWHSPFGATLINDACSSDPISVEAALRTLNTVSQAVGRKIFVFGGMRELGELGAREHAHIGELAAVHGVDTLVLPEDSLLDATAEAFAEHALHPEILRYSRPRELTGQLQNRVQESDTILFKGPREHDIARIAHEVFEAIAPNRLIVDMDAIAENVGIFRRIIGGRRLLAMIKALGYGSDMPRLSLELEKMGVDMFGVSTPDEGARLRRSGTRLPILVMICMPEEARKLVRHRLTPIISGEGLIEPLSAEASSWGRTVEVHLKVDTGMGRMGIPLDRLAQVVQRVQRTPYLAISGLMTHFGCADDPLEDGFTRRQIELFEEARDILLRAGLHDFTAHAAATAATVRFAESHFDMVRIGLGLYGLYPSATIREHANLRMAISLVSRIVEVRNLPAGARIGYGGTFVVPAWGARIGLVPMGYHDGIPWNLSNRGRVWVQGHPAPIVGRVSMDSLMVDITDVPGAERGADVLVFGRHGGVEVRPEEVATGTDTIVYELMTRVGPRVQRIFHGS